MLNAAINTTEYIGKITGLFADVLQGWVLNIEQPGVRLAVEVYIDGAYVALARADQPQQQYDEGDGFHGFAVPLRKQWLQNATTISVRIANHGPWLDGTVQLPESKPKDSGLGYSQVWYPGGLKVTGWACHATDASRHIIVVAREGDKVVASAIANQPHPALVNQESTDHGFDLDLPWELGDGKAHIIHLEDEEGQPLTGSPITVFFHPENLETLLRRQWPGEPDDSALELLVEAARDQDRRAPRTIGFAHYAKWLEVFQKPGPLTNEIPPLKAGILLYGEGSEQEEVKSRASIEAQRWPVHAVVKAEPNRLPQAAHWLLSQGADAIVPLHIGDHLASHALDTLLPLLYGDDAVVWAYADSDCDGPDGERTTPWLKPAWDIYLFLGVDLVTPGSVYSAELIRTAFGLPTHPRGGDIHGFAATVAAATYLHKLPVGHLPQVLYHQRYSAPANLAYAPADHKRQAAMQWLADFMAPGAQISVNSLYPALLQTKWPLPEQLPAVTLIIPTRDQFELLNACVEGLLNKTDYPSLEILIVDNDSKCPKTLDYLKSLKNLGIKVLHYPHPFNYSAINNIAVEIASGSIIGLINNDTEVIHPDWLRAMVAYFSMQDVGAVGAKLLWQNGMVQHGGVIVGINGLAAHSNNNLKEDDAGYLGLNQLTHSQSALTAACLLMRKQQYKDIGGLNERDFPITFNDVDLCLRIKKTGKTLIWTNLATLFHKESASRGKDSNKEKIARAMREQNKFREKWGKEYSNDVHYHPALNRDWAAGPYSGLGCTMIFEPRVITPTA